MSQCDRSFGLSLFHPEYPTHYVLLPNRTIRKPVRYCTDKTLSYALVTAAEGPSSFVEATEGEESGFQKEAMREKRTRRDSLLFRPKELM